MFHIDVTLEDTRIIAVEHRIPMDPDEVLNVEKFEAMSPKPIKLPRDKHDGTFDVTLADQHTGQTAVVNLTAEELAEGLRVGLLGLDTEEAYENPHIISLQGKLSELPSNLSFIP